MIINNVAKCRSIKNITQQELADKLNISRQTLISIEDNNVNISLKLAFEISKILGYKLEDLFMEKEEKDMNDLLVSNEEVKRVYGNHTIIIKNNLVYRCSTEVLERGPKCLLSYDLPKYGKMKKFILLNDRVYELMPTREYNNRTDIVNHKIGKEVNIDCSFIDFDESKTWN